MKHINIFLKPSSGLCNLNCTYCFYNNSETKKLHTTFMEFDTFKNAYSKASKIADHISIGFQGGEPLLIGTEFYNKVIAYTKQFQNTVHFSLQTNGTLITKEFAKLFKENNFLIGVSLDGIKHVHNTNRSNHQKTLDGIKLLQKYNVNFNILSVVTNTLVDHIDETLQYLEPYKNLQFIPCIDKDNQSFLTSKNYTIFLKKAFDFYLNRLKENNPISIQFFDNTYLKYIGQPSQVCSMRGHCSTQFVIESNGDVYSCDFYVDNNHKIGNINIDSYETMFSSTINQTFLKESFTLHPTCQKCTFLPLCKGGCKKNQIDGLNIYCPSLKEFYQYSHKGFQDMIKILNKSNT